jgi:hypothetical protein
MPAISLVVCVHLQRDLLERLLRESGGCYDDLVVVHDGPDTAGIRAMVEAAGGRFFERKREHQQEPHWPFAWEQAKHDWILRLDADEFPADEMKLWVGKFRQAAEPSAEISGYTCIWPLWNGKHQVSQKWPAGRLFLFNKQRVRFFGMCEQTPIPDGKCEALDLVLRHQPRRKSYGLYNMLIRKESRRVADIIARNLRGKPTDLACWRWHEENWPPHWEGIRRQPLSTAFKRLVKGTFSDLKNQWRMERRLFPVAAIGGPLHGATICLKFFSGRSKTKSGQAF